MHTDDDCSGCTVNKTARIAAAAVGGETLASGAAEEMAESDQSLGFGSPRELVLKGLPGRYIVFPLSEALTSLGRHRPRATSHQREGTDR